MNNVSCDLVVLGGGPGGYSAAFRAADLGRSVTIIEEHPRLGGVCLHVGCIPSKTLLHVSEVITQTQELGRAGVNFPSASIDLEQLRGHTRGVIDQLASGVEDLAKARSVDRITGRGHFASDTELLVDTDTETLSVSFNDIIIATGSSPAAIPGFPYEDERVWDSSKALKLEEIPRHLVIIGGGIIGLEMAAIYHGLGSEIMIIEMTKELIPAADKDIKQPLIRAIKNRYAAIYTSTRVTGITADKDALHLTLEGAKAPSRIDAEAVLVAVGRTPNSGSLGLEHTSIETDQKGFISVNSSLKTSTDHIYAIGDVTGNPMLAHRAVHQGKTAAEVLSGLSSDFSPMSIPSVAYTQPEIAWTGITEREAKEQNISYVKGRFPWKASGRAITAMADEGTSKALFDEKTGRLIGAAITGIHAGELIGEAALALEMGAVAEDIARTIHPHPTLSETFAFSAEAADGSITELLGGR
ncbi:MAG: dihydrolipoyl dehydrogenase [Spirochaetia bacterium]|nr:dihydrolipoyl dehydrogenase [Spirochaetia bacterium]MCF7940370.1 dihydrolipoyl dehydrogenase [Spirochaetia bacterium]